MLTGVMVLPLDQWLDYSIAQKHGALSPQSHILKTLLENRTNPEVTAKELITTTQSSRDAADTSYRLWHLLFHTAANLPTHITVIVNLTLAIYNIPPSLQAPNALSYHLWTNWQDVYSYYYTYRTLAAAAAPSNLTNANRWINFSAFSAILLDQSKTEIFVREIGIRAFFDLRNALEATLKTYAIKTLLQNSVVTAEQAMEIDIVAAAQWVIYAGDKLVHLDNAIFGDLRSRGLNKETELWDGETGFSKARWMFWARRFGERANEEWVCEGGSRVAKEAANIIRGHLSQQSGQSP